MLWTCFSSAPTVKTSVAAMPAFDRPSASRPSTSRSRGVSPLDRVAMAAAGEQRRDEIGVERRSS
jgi:hypothetical protein